MSHKTPSQQKYFDDLYELYHFNPFHDKMGRFARSSGAARGYVGKDGRLTEKAMRRLNVADTKSSASGSDSDGDSDSGGKGDGEGKKKDKKAKIRVDSTGRVVAEDQNKAISEIEKQISKDYGDKSKMLNDSSRLVNDLARFNESNRNRAAKNKATREDLSSMSNEDLKSYIDKRIERMNLERKYREIKESDYNRGRDRFDDMLETAGKLLALGATAATIAATIHTLKS